LKKGYDMKDKSQMVPGVSTTTRTRPLMISALEMYMRERTPIIRSKRLIQELFVFIWLNGKAQSQQGYNDATQTITDRGSMGSTGDNQDIVVGTGYWGYSTMRVAAILMYNRQLSSTEITQNYDYFNTRY
jgi:hypothetical protein